MSAKHSALAHHFDSLEQQHEASLLGMWMFLATEVLFFGGLFLAYAVYRMQYPEAFELGSGKLDVLLGTINTGVLIGSSLTMALAVRGAQVGSRQTLIVCLLLTIALGTTFLGIKAIEWHHDYEIKMVPAVAFDESAWPSQHAGHVKLYFVLYFSMTGLHALHMIAGIGVLGILVVLARRNCFSPDYYTPVELSGLYWHFVDVVWIFLFPLFYLVGAHLGR